MPEQKRIIDVLSAPQPHWVGDGFPVRTILSAHGQDASAISPFLLLDYAGPHQFAPSNDRAPRGVDQHPHRGFETVTIIYQGELEHRDSSGARGKIGPGDVQWMTAASGIVHEEKHSDEFTRRGGTLEMIQLWVNLPANEKKAPPRYQDILNDSIPVIDLPNDAGTVRVIAGDYGGTRGPARTATPMNVWDVKLAPRASTTFDLPLDTNTIIVVLHGEATINDAALATHQAAILSSEGERVTIAAGQSGSTLALLNGEPIDEPVVAHGPFVMNTAVEIKQAMIDYQSGRMGRLEPIGR